MEKVGLPTVPYSIERTRNRSSRAVFRHGEILIRLAGRLSKNEEREHIEILLRRMTKAAARDLTRRSIDPFRPLLKKTTALLDLELCTNTRIIFSVHDGLKTRAQKTEEGWNISRSQKISDHSFHLFLWKLLSLSLLPEITNLVNDINERTLGVPIRSVRLKFMRSRWGSCSHNGKVALSTALLFTTADILEYVIVHELAHVVHMNHSPKFWTLVERHIPDYKKCVKELRMFKFSQRDR